MKILENKEKLTKALEALTSNIQHYEKQLEILNQSGMVLTTMKDGEKAYLYVSGLGFNFSNWIDEDTLFFDTLSELSDIRKSLKEFGYSPFIEDYAPCPERIASIKEELNKYNKQKWLIEKLLSSNLYV